MIDPAQRRLAAALVASAVLHGWLVHAAQGMQAQHRVQRHATANRVPITVLFRDLPNDFLRPDFNPRIARVPLHEVIQSAPAQPPVSMRSGTVAELKTVEHSVARPGTDTTDSRVVLPQPRDSTYYSALSLDVYPTVATQLDMGALLAADRYASGQVRATVLIDESGLVNEVRGVEAVAPAIETLARELLLHTRFTPARKDGRIVKAQVRVSLDYGPR